jgi:Na+/phosphate symporter
MEEKRLTNRISETFSAALPIMKDARRGFVKEDAALVKESITKFRELLKSRGSTAESIIRKEDKTDEEKKYVTMIIPLQAAAVAIENVMEKMAIKVEAKIPFTEKALKEIDSLLILVYAQLTDAKDCVVTGNAHLKENVHKNKEEIRRLAAEYDLVHQNRLIAGVCMPKASYLYIDITDSLKRAARALAEFCDKL